VVGSGPGGLQTSYCLSRLGVTHAVISADPVPGGMFQRFPIFQRLISWTKPYAPAERGSRAYEWYDWNSLLGEDEGNSALVAGFMDGSGYFPSRSEMQMGLTAFAERSQIQVRYGCVWESTSHENGLFKLGTSDGEYTCGNVVFAIGTTSPWKPRIPGLEEVPHYADARPLDAYRNKQVFVIGKRNSGFEVADALLPIARRIFLASPTRAKISVVEHAAIGARARYLQPYEDHVFGGGNVLLDVAIDRVERLASGYRVSATETSRPRKMVLEVDDVVAATGFTTPLQDLPKLGVAIFNEGKLPALTPFWESVSVPGLYFAGSTTQAAAGLNKYGIPANSAAVQGFRYNARVLAEHIAQERFGIRKPRARIDTAALVPYLLAEATRAPELWNQRSYLARVVGLGDGDVTDEGIMPLAHFVDSAGPDAVAVAVETDSTGDIHPAIYLKRSGRVQEHLLPSHPLHSFETIDHQTQLEALLKPYIG
jgi:thioredoxin reductase